MTRNFGWGIVTGVLLTSILLEAGPLVYKNINNRNTGVVSSQGNIIIPTPSPTVDPYGDWTYDNLLIQLNNLRLAHNLPQVKDDQYLASESQKTMVNNCPVTSHTSFRNEYNAGDFKKYGQVAQELASGYPTPFDTLEGLLADPAHADTLIGASNNWKYVGIGIGDNHGLNCVSFIFGN